MARKDRYVTTTLDEETADLLERIAEELTEGNRSQANRRAIQTAARVLLDPKPSYRTLARGTSDAYTN